MARKQSASSLPQSQGSGNDMKDKKFCSSTLTKHDIFAYNPNYEWTSHKTLVGTILSYLTIAFIVFYIGLTARDYFVRPPELVSQGDIDLITVAREIPFPIPRVGIRVAYTNATASTDDGDISDDRIAALENDNRYVRYRARHVVIQNQIRIRETELPVDECIVSSEPSVCPDTTSYTLQGTFYKKDYEFLVIIIEKCINRTRNNNNTNVPLNCASLDQINEKLTSGEFRIRAQVSLEAQQFDVERFHDVGTGVVISNRSFEYFAIPDLEVKSDLVLKARYVSKEQRYIGSPPMPEAESQVLSFDRRETSYRPRSSTEARLMTFVLRLDDNVGIDEVSYWCPSLLDLFGLWGAMASFAASLSLGFLALQYNKWHFHRHFRIVARQKKHEARLQTLAAIEWLRNENNFQPKATRNRENMYQNLQEQYDALMVEADLRLFESHHFDPDGRVTMSAAELKHPSTAFGELRRLALIEHGKRRRAAEFLSLWYARHLVKRGFIRDEQRRYQLFAPESPMATDASSRSQRNFLPLKRLSKERLPSFLRQRRKKKSSSSASSASSSEERNPVTPPRHPDLDRSRVDIESGISTMNTNHADADTQPSTMSSEANHLPRTTTSSIEVPAGAEHQPTDQTEDTALDGTQQRALEVIAELDPVTDTKKPTSEKRHDS